MSEIDRFISQPVDWLCGSGPESDIVISSRLRLARNLKAFPFPARLKTAQRVEIIQKVEEAVRNGSFLKGAFYIQSKDLSETDRQFLLERHLVSKEHIAEEGLNAVAITPNEIVSLMVLEEDHLRLQVFQSGLNLVETWRIANEIDDELEKNLEFAFDANLGYLTACPTNVGTGLRASCMLHLPSLVLTKQIHKVLQALSKLNLAVRGLYGEGTQAMGNFFQFSNQMTLGQPEEEIIDNLEGVIRQVITHEKEARDYLRKKRKIKMADQVWRSLATLKAARIVSSSEAVQLLSLVQAGVDLGILEGLLTHKDLNQLFLLIQPAHLQKMNAKELTANERDIRRAEMIREYLSKVTF